MSISHAVSDHTLLRKEFKMDVYIRCEKDVSSLRIELCNYGNDARNFDFASLYDFVDIGDLSRYNLYKETPV